MRRLSCIVVAALIALAASGFSHGDVLALREGWSLQSSAHVDAPGETISVLGFAAKEWYLTTVPATVLAALVENKVYPDPFYGDNITKIPGYRKGLWLAMSEESPFWPSWWYRTEFELPAEFQGKNLVLHLDGINYRANVWLNGKRIASSEEIVGMFRRFELDINDVAQCGKKNCLALEITAPGHIPEKHYGTKQVEATTGWDDHNPQPPDLNMGIWQDVYISATGPVALRDPYVGTRLEVPGLERAHLTVSARAVNKTNEPVSGILRGVIENVTFEQSVSLGAKESKVVEFTPEAFTQLNFDKPRVWWPNGVGAQELYDLHLEFSAGGAVSDTAKTRFGIREATTYINDEGWRGYKINGRNILIRGGAWMTSDMLLRFSHRRYEALVRYAKEAHLNMLRSEGFSIRETDDFYNLCDEYGVMVTQQLFGRSIPDEPLAIACVEDTLLRIRNHPSLVHFLGHDETFPTKNLDEAYRDLIARLIPDRTYQPHSGAFELDERFKTGGTRTGSLQVWTYATPIHYYISKDTGAWGFAQSGGIGGVVASLGSMRRMMPAEDLWPPSNDVWSLHTVAQGWNYFSPILKALGDRYGRPSDIEDYCRKAWALNYESARGMFEAYGRNKYKATGITTWKYDAAWPASPTWQYIDWYLVPTGAYYGAKKACEPLHVQYSYDDNTVYVVNGLYQDFTGLRVTAKLLNLDYTEKFVKSMTVDVKADDKTLAMTIDQPNDLSRTHFLILTLEDSGGALVSENFYWLSTVPDKPSRFAFMFATPESTANYQDLASLEPVKLETATQFEDANGERLAHVDVLNSSNRLAFMVRLAVTCGTGGPEVAPVYWEDNCFSLLPGQRKRVTARFAPNECESAEPAIAVTGWNVGP